MELDDNCLIKSSVGIMCTLCLELYPHAIKIGDPILYYNMPPPLTQEQINYLNKCKARWKKLPLTNEEINKINKYRKKKE